MNRDVMRTFVKQVSMELEFAFIAVPLTVLGLDVVPRIVRYVGYRAMGMRTETANIFAGLQVAGPPRRLALGKGTFLNRGVFVELVGRVTLGREVQVGPQAAFITSHHAANFERGASKHVVARDIHIDDRCWIGARVVVLPGVHIADNITVAAGAVVTRDLDVVGGTYAGVPARLVKTAQPPEVKQ